MSTSVKHFYDFDRFRIDLDERLLLLNGDIVPLTQKAFEVLLALVERQGQIVEKEELMQIVWPETFVEEGNLSQNIYTLRKVLGETLDGQEFIKTITKRGYRFVPNVSEQWIRDDDPSHTVNRQSDEKADFDIPVIDNSPSTHRSVVVQFPTENRSASLRQTVTNNHKDSWISQHKILTAILAITLLISSLGSLFWLAEPSGWNLFSSDSTGAIKLTNLTTTGNITCAVVSPDGKYVAYGVMETAQRSSLWLMQLVSLSSRQIIPPSEILYHALTFSHDGQFLFYVAKENNSRRNLHRVSVLGGPSTKLVEDVQTAVSFSPDGTRMAFRRASDDRRQAILFIADIDGSNERELTASNYPENFGDPAWSPDGKMIACATGHAEGGANMYAVGVRVDDGAVKKLTAQRFRWIGQMAWLSDSSGLMMVASRGPDEINQVWRLDYSTGETRRMTNDGNYYNRLSLSADGKTMVVSQIKQVTNVWMIPLEEPGRQRQVTFGTGGYRGRLSWTRDGRIVYDSETGNATTISVMDADGSNQKLLLGEQINNAFAGRAHVSPNGRHIVFASDSTGTRHIWRMDLDGNNLKQLTNGDGEDTPHCSPDGRWVVYTKLERKGFNRPTIWRVSIDGGKMTQLTDDFTAYPAVSPDGKLIACARSSPWEPWQIGIYPFEGGKPVKIFPQHIQGFPLIRWTPDGRNLTYDENPVGPAKLWLQPLDGGEPKLLAEFVSDRIFGFDWSPDGKQLALVRGLWSTNAVLIENFKSRR